jgi:hypothetical protein
MKKYRLFNITVRSYKNNNELSNEYDVINYPVDLFAYLNESITDKVYDYLFDFILTTTDKWSHEFNYEEVAID